jgi:hypothetical protein
MREVGPVGHPLDVSAVPPGVRIDAGDGPGGRR